MKTLAIETSCDDTSLAIVTYRDGFFVVEKILAYTQTAEHQQRWGVVPELAARTHAEKIMTILEELAVDWSTIETISVTAHPWLPWALIVGITTAYTLGAIYDKPVVEVNHIMGHVFSVLVERSLSELHVPYICLTVSGGHNDLYLVERNDKKSIPHVQVEEATHTKHNHLMIGASLDIWSFVITKLGQTIDDAAGECFDKVARMLGGPYPWGRWIGELAKSVDTHLSVNTTSPVPHLIAARLPDQPLNFSFSGIKGQLHQHIETGRIDIDNDTQKAQVAFIFQEEVTEVLTEKLRKAVVTSGAKTVGVVGGVSANTRLREKIATHPELSERNVLFPTKMVYCTDNAAMIGVVGLLMRM
jgi:N6-L-threonylcarbamoyladenine synthase